MISRKGLEEIVSKKLIIRVDGNAEIGSGHVMRCISISNAAKKMGIDVVFITADESFIDVFDTNGLKVRILNTIYSRMDTEIELFCAILEEEKPDYILVDSYYVTFNYLKVLKAYAKLIYIDDVLTFPYPVDVLINYNIYASKVLYKTLYNGYEMPKLLIGGYYTPLREEFQNIDAIGVDLTVENVLFSAGGADSERIAYKFVDKIVSSKKMKKVNFHIVIGSFEPDKDKIEAIAATHNNIITHKNVDKMSDLMRKCDVAISAAGFTLYELCSCGVPTITYILADNQILGATTFESMGLMINAGDYRYCPSLMDNLINSIESLSQNYDKRLFIQNRMKECVNGNGAVQIVREMIEV